MKQVTAPVISNSEVMPGVYLAWFEAPEIAQLARPGQFVMVHCGGESILPRPLSIHQRDGNKIALLFAVVGKGTAWLSQRKAGNNVNMFGPLGNGFSIQSDSHNLLLLAGGMGIAPLNFLAIEAQKKGCSVTLREGVKTRLHVRKDEDKPAKVTSITVTEDGSMGEKGLVIDGLSELLSQTDQIFACGPVGMYQAMAKMPELRNKPVQISLEVRMGCGRGVCYGCTVKTKEGLKQVCTDGPVFNLDDILWDELDY